MVSGHGTRYRGAWVFESPPIYVWSEKEQEMSMGRPREDWVAKPDWEEPGQGSRYGVLLWFKVTGRHGRNVNRFVSVAMTLEEAKLMRRHLDNFIRDMQSDLPVLGRNDA